MPGKSFQNFEHKLKVPEGYVIIKTENNVWQKAFFFLCSINTIAVIILAVYVYSLTLPGDTNKTICTCPADVSKHNNENNLEIVNSDHSESRHREKRSEVVIIAFLQPFHTLCKAT